MFQGMPGSFLLVTLLIAFSSSTISSLYCQAALRMGGLKIALNFNYASIKLLPRGLACL